MTRLKLGAIPVLLLIGVLMVVWELCGHSPRVMAVVRRLDPVAYRLAS